jgi:hypothetical protein
MSEASRRKALLERERRARERREQEQERKLEKERERERRLSEAAQVASSAPAQDAKGFRAWHISLGIPAAFVAIGIGLAVAGGSYFWTGIVLAYAGIAWLLLDWWFFSKTLSGRIRLVGTGGTLVFALVVSWIAFRPAPLEIFSTATDLDYTDGSDVFGIKWNDLYSDLRTNITNTSSDQYTDLEIFIRTDLQIRDMAFLGRLQCSHNVWLPVQISATGLKAKDSEGKTVAVPLNLTTGTIFRIFCDKLLPSERIEIVSAIVPIKGKDRKKPVWVYTKINYNAYGRARAKEFTQCFIAKCTIPDLPLQNGYLNIF